MTVGKDNKKNIRKERGLVKFGSFQEIIFVRTLVIPFSQLPLVLGGLYCKIRSMT